MSKMTKAELEAALYSAENAPLEKKWWTSKTLWVNLAQFIAGAALLVAELPAELDTAAYAMLVNGLAQTALRVWGTETKLTK